MASLYILGQLVDCMAILVFLWQFRYIFPRLVFCIKINLAVLVSGRGLLFQSRLCFHSQCLILELSRDRCLIKFVSGATSFFQHKSAHSIFGGKENISAEQDNVVTRQLIIRFFATGEKNVEGSCFAATDKQCTRIYFLEDSRRGQNLRLRKIRSFVSRVTRWVLEKNRPIRFPTHFRTKLLHNL
jgi:hypothetical protein